MSIEPGKHLDSTIHNFHGYGLGNCFQRSVAMVMDRPTSRLVVANFRSKRGNRYLHCFVQEHDAYYDPVRFEDHGGLDAFDRDYLERANDARDIKVVTRKQVMDLAKAGNLSKWMLRPDLPKHQFAKTIGEELLDMIGYPYHVDTDGGILPA